MKKSEFLALIDQTFATMHSISSSKGEEYSHDADQLANFKRLGAQLNLPPESTLWVYLTKHLDSITSYVNDITTKKSRVLSEPIEGRIDDAILYLMLLKGLVREREGRPTVTIAQACHGPTDLARVLREPPAAPSIEEMQDDIASWANIVFPHRTAHGSLAKLVLEEIPEFITAGMKDPLEYADLVIMILDIAHLQGINVGQALVEKMAINKQRVWRVDEETGFLKHIEPFPSPITITRVP